MVPYPTDVVKIALEALMWNEGHPEIKVTDTEDFEKYTLFTMSDSEGHAHYCFYEKEYQVI